MDTLHNSRREEGEDEEITNPKLTEYGGEADDNDGGKNEEAVLCEPIPLPQTLTEPTLGVIAENPSPLTSMNTVEVGEEIRDEIMEDLPAEISKLEVNSESQKSSKEQPFASEEPSSDSTSEEVQNLEISETPNKSPDTVKLSDEDEDEPLPKKQKHLSLLTPHTPATIQQSEIDQCGNETEQSEPKSANGNGSNTNGKKSKKKSKNNNVWTKPTSRKGKKKTKNNNTAAPKAEDTVLITPVPRFPDKNDDSPDMKICLSKVYKAEKVELSEDRLCAGSCKGYRMVRATRGVSEGAWYFEIKVLSLGETGHTRLGWSTEKGDLQAQVGYDANSFGYRDIDGSKIHKALREKYGEHGYKEGDIIGFYISLPEGSLYVPKQPQLVLYKGQRYVCAPDAKEDPLKVVPGSEISFFKNGVCQGVAFKDLYGGRYYPAASMYTLPNQPNCQVKFNFGPDFECFPEDLEGRPLPKPMIEVPYPGFDNRIENGESSEKNQ